jgi:hypothetical protein
MDSSLLTDHQQNPSPQTLNQNVIQTDASDPQPVPTFRTQQNTQKPPRSYRKIDPIEVADGSRIVLRRKVILETGNRFKNP